MAGDQTESLRGSGFAEEHGLVHGDQEPEDAERHRDAADGEQAAAAVAYTVFEDQTEVAHASPFSAYQPEPVCLSRDRPTAVRNRRASGAASESDRFYCYRYD